MISSSGAGLQPVKQHSVNVLPKAGCRDESPTGKDNTVRAMDRRCKKRAVREFYRKKQQTDPVPGSVPGF